MKNTAKINKRQESVVVPKGATQRVNNENGIVGECADLLNMRECNDALRVVGEAKCIGKFQSGERLLCVVNRGALKYHIVVGAEGTIRCYIVGSDGNLSANGQVLAEFADRKVIGAVASSDFIIVNTNQGREFFHFSDGVYSHLSLQGAIPKLVLGTSERLTIQELFDEYTFASPYSHWGGSLDGADEAELTHRVIDLYSRIEASAHSKGRFLQPTMLRYGVRLWDDSYLWLSAAKVVGEGYQITDYSKTEVNSTSTGFVGTNAVTVAAQAYHAAVSVLGGTDSRWDKLIKSIDILVCDESVPFSSDRAIDYRCETTTSGTRRYYLSFRRTRKSENLATLNLVNASKWYRLCSVSDLEGLRQGRFSAGNANKSSDTSGGTLASRTYSIIRTGAMIEALSAAENRAVMQAINHEVESTSMLSHNGRVYSGGNYHLLQNAWHTIDFWNNNVHQGECRVVTIVELSGKNGPTRIVRVDDLNHYPTALNPLLSYPDSRAVRMTIRVKITGENVKEWYSSLVPSQDNTFAYSVNSRLENEQFLPTVYNEIVTPNEVNRRELHETELTISKGGNPMVGDQVRNVGDNGILALAVSARPIFSSVFGRYPIYAFTRDGIFAVSYRTMSDYRDAQIIDYRVINNAILPTHGSDSVYFVDTKGDLCKLLGRQVEEVKRQLSPKSIAWNWNDDELWIVIEGEETLVMMPSQRFYRRSEELQSLFSDFHESIGIKSDGEVIDLQREDATHREVRLTTHPITQPNDVGREASAVEWNIEGRASECSLSLSSYNGWNAHGELAIKLKVKGEIMSPLFARVLLPRKRKFRFCAIGGFDSGTIFRGIKLLY